VSTSPPCGQTTVTDVCCLAAAAYGCVLLLLVSTALLTFALDELALVYSTQ